MIEKVEHASRVLMRIERMVMILMRCWNLKNNKAITLTEAHMIFDIYTNSMTRSDRGFVV